jgi:hypothetical protein
MDSKLRPIRPESVPKALLKAERYRLLSEPREAESICRDILAADPGNQQALATLVLALTDQFTMNAGARPQGALELVAGLTDPYERAYFEGVVCERWAKAQLNAGTPGHIVHDWFEQAMDCFGSAIELSPPGNDDAVLRWNTCVRLLGSHPEVSARAEELASRDDAGDLDEDVPLR